MKELQAYTTFVESALKDLSLPQTPSNLYDPIRYFLTIGGKRIRPVLTLLGTELFGKDKSEALPQALAIEIFHNFTLIHDDIMDQAPLRRNQATIHHKWNQNVGILSGDVMMIHAYQHLSAIQSDKLADALKLFNSTAIEVCEGQQLDMDFEVREDVSIHEYIEMIRLKTSVLLGCALQLGGIVAGAQQADLDALNAFGQHIGIAFQIQDDILDLYADPEKFGKQVGGDVISNKKTILYLTAMTECTREQLDLFKYLRSEKNPEVKIRKTRELFDHLEVKKACTERMEDHYQRALDSLEKINVPDDNKKALINLARFLIDRDL